MDNREALDRAWRILDDVNFEVGLAEVLGATSGMTVEMPQDAHECAAVVIMMAHIARLALSTAHHLCLNRDPPIDIPIDGLVDIVRDASYGG